MRHAHGIVTIIAVIILLAAANYFFARHPLRLDLTENDIYTLAPATRAVLDGLDDVVTVRLYFTRDLPPQLEPLRRGVDDLLEEFKRVAGARLQIEAIDPGQSLMEEQKAALVGIPPIQLNVVRHDKQEVAKIFLGIAVLHGDREEVLPVVDRLENLEYELTVAIMKVATQQRPAIGWWTPGYAPADPLDGFGGIRSLLEQRYTVTDLDAEQPDGLDPKTLPAIVLASPRAIAPEALAALDRYLADGGRLIALIDRAEVTPAMERTAVETDAVAWLARYGIAIGEGFVLDTASAMASFAGGMVTYRMAYPYWLDVRRDRFNGEVPIVADLEQAILPWTNAIALSPEGHASETALALSTAEAVVAPPEAALAPQAAAESFRTGEPGRRVLIALARGPFADGGEAGGRIFAVGSSRWVRDRFLQEFPANATLFENAVDDFVIGDALIGIRSRAITARPIAALSDSTRSIVRSANIAAGPILLGLIGAAVWLARRRHRRRAIARYGGHAAAKESA